MRADTAVTVGAMEGLLDVILTVVDDDETVFEAIKCGAEGYLLKDLEAYQLYILQL